MLVDVHGPARTLLNPEASDLHMQHKCLTVGEGGLGDVLNLKH